MMKRMDLLNWLELVPFAGPARGHAKQGAGKLEGIVRNWKEVMLCENAEI